VKTIDVWVDSEPPHGTVHINDGAPYTASASVTLTVSGRDTGSGVAKMRFRNEVDPQWSPWLDDARLPVPWTLSSGPDGTRRVYAEFKDYAGNISPETEAYGEIMFRPNYAARYNITFLESGLPLGTAWSVSVGGVPETSTGDTIVFQLSNGTGYVYTVTSVSGFDATTYTGIFHVTGQPVTIPVSWTHSTGGPPGTQGPEGPQGPQGVAGQPGTPSPSIFEIAYVVIAIAGVAIGTASVAVLSLRRKRSA